MAWSSFLIGFIGLACREASLVWVAPELWAFAAITYWGMEAHRALSRSAEGRVRRVEERTNTTHQELQCLEELRSRTEGRLQQYHRLRQVANAFAVSLEPEVLSECIVQSAGELIPAADRVLLYGIDPKGLHLELRKVWRRSGRVPIREKKGDAFDQWVMRQGQPLLVEEVAKDFRFQEAGSERAGRPLGSVLAVPLALSNRFLGVLRLESESPGSLLTDDLRLVGIVADLAALAVENSSLYGRMAQLAITDDLTGLAVRGHFERELARHLEQAQEEMGGLSLLLIDIDRFKVYNDGFGHSAGDKLLREIGQLLKRIMRPDDLAARYGGEEFVCLLSRASQHQAAHKAEEIRQTIEQTPIWLRRTVTRTTVSIGVSTFPEDGRTVESLIAAADRRLYRAKEAGRNRVVASG